MSSADSRIAWGGGNWFLHGANLPWYNWACDFGCGASTGVSSPASKSAIGARFAAAKAGGIKNIRWWMFEGDAWQITRDSQGAPASINPAVFADIDAALALAEQHDLYYDFVLFNSPTAIPSAWVNDAAQRTKLAQVLGTLFARYRNNPRIVSWEVFNEPEWTIWNGSADQSSVQATVKSVADAVHANSTAKVTVGSAMLDGLGMWVGLGLDYYRAHWYDYMSSGNWCAMCTDYAGVRAKYSLDKPLVIGEMYAGADIGAEGRFESLYDKGYAGSFAWSLFTEKTSDGMVVDLTASGRFAGAHTDIGPRGLSSSPTPTATPTSQPATATPTKTIPTATPTQAAPTATPTQPSPTATPAASATPEPSFAASVKLSAQRVSAGSSLKVTTSVTASTTTKALVAVQIYSPSGSMVTQKAYDNQSFSTGMAKSFSFTWSPGLRPAKGTYTVKVGVWKPGWGTLLKWVDQAATFTVR